VSAEAAQQLFEVLKDARPKNPRAQHKYPEKTSAPAGAAVSCKPALKAIRFNVQLPALGGAVELCLGRGFLPVHCKRCGLERENVQESLRDEKTRLIVRWWRPLPCPCGGAR